MQVHVYRGYKGMSGYKVTEGNGKRQFTAIQFACIRSTSSPRRRRLVHVYIYICINMYICFGTVRAGKYIVL